MNEAMIAVFKAIVLDTIWYESMSQSPNRSQIIQLLIDLWIHSNTESPTIWLVKYGSIYLPYSITTEFSWTCYWTEFQDSQEPAWWQRQTCWLTRPQVVQEQTNERHYTSLRHSSKFPQFTRIRLHIPQCCAVWQNISSV